MNDSFSGQSNLANRISKYTSSSPFWQNIKPTLQIIARVKHAEDYITDTYSWMCRISKEVQCVDNRIVCWKLHKWNESLRILNIIIHIILSWGDITFIFRQRIV